MAINRRSINRNARPEHLLSVVRQPLAERRRELTWECVQGAPGFYQPMPFNQEPVPGKGRKFIYKGCGVIEPRNIGGYLHRRTCACENEARRLYEEHQQRLQWKREQTKMTYGWLGELKSDLKLTEKSFENYDRSKQPDAYDAVLRYAETVSGTLILHGDYGVGKTHLLAALCNELLFQQVPCLFVTAPKLFESIQERVSLNQPWVQIINRAVNTPFLVIDDIDKAKPSDHRKEVYFAIIDERAKAGRPIAISTNKLDELANFVGAACASRLSIKRVAPKMVGEDYRPNL